MTLLEELGTLAGQPFAYTWDVIDGETGGAYAFGQNASGRGQFRDWLGALVFEVSTTDGQLVLSDGAINLVLGNAELGSVRPQKLYFSIQVDDGGTPVNVPPTILNIKHDPTEAVDG